MAEKVERVVHQAADAVRKALGDRRPEVAIVLGSGLGGLADAVSDPIAIPYSSIEGFPAPKVVGHAGKLVAGVLDDVPVLMQSGRFHLYEGHDPSVVVLPVRVFAELGIGALIVTNAAGGVRPSLPVPGLMLIADHINLMWRSPLLGPVFDSEERFPDMSAPYDGALRSVARETALQAGIALEEGVYAGVLGPSYETPAEIRMLQRIGADAVGMSTVPEVITAAARGLRALGISTISNYASGISTKPLSHEEVLEAGKVVSGDLERLVRGIVRHNSVSSSVTTR